MIFCTSGCLVPKKVPNKLIIQCRCSGVEFGFKKQSLPQATLYFMVRYRPDRHLSRKSLMKWSSSKCFSLLRRPNQYTCTLFFTVQPASCICKMSFDDVNHNNLLQNVPKTHWHMMPDENRSIHIHTHFHKY